VRYLNLNSLFATMLAVALCAGCSGESNPAQEPVDVATRNGMRGNMQEIRLKDGTRCVTWKSGYGGGLSCEWRRSK